MNQPLKNIKAIRSIIEKHHDHSKNISLIAVSKQITEQNILPLLEAKHQDFGENRIQEMTQKWSRLLEKYPKTKLHFIGPLQSNKVSIAMRICHTIHSLDRVNLAHKIADEIQKQGHHPDIFIQINTGEEKQKSGILPQEADKFIIACRQEYGLHISGLTCLPPSHSMPAPHFALMEKIAQRHRIDYLSMGMSQDFSTALLFGATHLRIGTAIFGKRPPL